MNKFFNMHVTHGNIWTPEEYGITADHFFVKTSDSLKISAWEVMADSSAIDIADTTHDFKGPKAVIICLSGIHNPSATAYFGHAKMFSKMGYATFIMEMRAHGESEGDMICIGYKEYKDVEAVVNHINLLPQYKNVPIVIMGLSMGAATAINSIGEIPQLAGLISLSSFSSAEDVLSDMMEQQVPAWLKIPKFFIQLDLFFKYGKDIFKIVPKKEITKLNGRPALLMHTKLDDNVPFKSFERLMKAAPAGIDTLTRNINEHFVCDSFANPQKDTLYWGTVQRFLNKNFAPLYPPLQKK
jgi:uncharacterized protein